MPTLAGSVLAAPILAHSLTSPLLTVAGVSGALAAWAWWGGVRVLKQYEGVRARISGVVVLLGALLFSAVALLCVAGLIGDSLHYFRDLNLASYLLLGLLVACPAAWWGLGRLRRLPEPLPARLRRLRWLLLAVALAGSLLWLLGGVGQLVRMAR